MFRLSHSCFLRQITKDGDWSLLYSRMGEITAERGLSCQRPPCRFSWKDVPSSIEEPTPKISLSAAFEIFAWSPPFNSAVTIALDIPVGDGSPAPISVEIYDVNGWRIDVIARRVQPDEAISYGCEKDCFGQSPSNDNAGEFTWTPAPSLPSGVYLVRARFDSAQRPDGGRGDLDPTGKTATRRVVYLK